MKLLSCLVLILVCGCGHLHEVRSKNKYGPEYRTNATGRNTIRWTAQTGVEFKWDQGITTGVTYRRRDVDNGSGGIDNGVWFEFSFPVWRRQKPDLKKHIQLLEQRIAQLEK